MRQVDQREKICYLCNSKADIIINKKYYCATALNKITGGNMEKVILEARTRSPEEKIWIAVNTAMFEDAFELGVWPSTYPLQKYHKLEIGFILGLFYDVV